MHKWQCQNMKCARTAINLGIYNPNLTHTTVALSVGRAPAEGRVEQLYLGKYWAWLLTNSRSRKTKRKTEAARNAKGSRGSKERKLWGKESHAKSAARKVIRYKPDLVKSSFSRGEVHWPPASLRLLRERRGPHSQSTRRSA
eukprot:6194317-Pleurochrysis_carterae.AAC.2